ncbi:MAG: flagellar FlbD family protein [Oscillospiraceae bacterium]|nr:flagellar FlbD family protein [Oscillospiraceae bacterium]
MVLMTRLNGKEFYVNPDLIEFIEETPDSVITLLDGKKLVVLEKADVIIGRIIQYRAAVFVNLPVHTKQDPP